MAKCIQRNHAAINLTKRINIAPRQMTVKWKRRPAPSGVVCDCAYVDCSFSVRATVSVFVCSCGLAFPNHSTAVFMIK